MSRDEIRLSGFGGQGIITAGYILGKAAALFDAKHVTLNKSYGPESRGGACSAQLIIGTDEINYPQLIEPTLLVAMSQEAYEKYIGELASGGTLLIDEDLVDMDRPRDDVEIHSIPSTRIAENQIGRKIVANIVMLGFVAAHTDAVSSAAIREAVLSSVPKGTEEMNEAAFDAGLAYASESRQQPAEAGS
jgi:2-oxoglutarate ferredoxin oxidoreductase subunit gamma